MIGAIFYCGPNGLAHLLPFSLDSVACLLANPDMPICGCDFLFQAFSRPESRREMIFVQTISISSSFERKKFVTPKFKADKHVCPLPATQPIQGCNVPLGPGGTPQPFNFLKLKNSPPVQIHTPGVFVCICIFFNDFECTYVAPEVVNHKPGIVGI